MKQSPGVPAPVYLLDTYRFDWEAVGVTATLENVHEERGGIGGILTVSSSGPPAPGIMLPRTRINDILAPTWRKQVQQHLEAMDSAVDWQALIGQLVTLSDARWRQGEPVVDLRASTPDRSKRWLLPNLLELGQNNVIFADGGTGKSLLALTAGLSVASGAPLLGRTPTETGAVLYLDWEADEDTHAIRLQALLEGYQLPLGDVYHEILYRPQYGRLHEAASSLRNLVAEYEVRLVIVDSMGAATAGEEGREAVVKTFNALRSLKATCLVIDHVTKAEGQDPKRPYGSVYTHDLARVTFRLDKAQGTNENHTVIALSHMKSNNGRFLPKQAFRAWFENDDEDVLFSARYEPWDVLNTPSLAGRGDQQGGILAILRGSERPLTVEGIADAWRLEMPDRDPPSANAIRSSLSRLAKKGLAANAGGMWSMVATRTEPASAGWWES